jgi:acid phosphatase family membrane protein YuiD
MEPLTNHLIGQAYPLIAALASVSIAQILKLIHLTYNGHKNQASNFITSGGMPSSHSALVTSLTVALFFQEGWQSNLFAISFVFSCVVLYDSAGIRQSVGKHAKHINNLHDQIKIPSKKLSEFLGHTPLEVLVGACLGAVIASILFFI